MNTLEARGSFCLPITNRWKNLVICTLKNGQCLPHLMRGEINTLSALSQNVFFDENNLTWIRLEYYKYPRTALWLLEFYHKEALCESHN